MLDQDPAIAAQHHADKHVIKMILESGQMLCAAHPEVRAPWKRSHYNHPCTVWTRTSKANYEWLDSFENVVICFDNDDAGIKLENELKKLMG